MMRGIVAGAPWIGFVLFLAAGLVAPAASEPAA
jgi:hypothetical protein